MYAHQVIEDLSFYIENKAFFGLSFKKIITDIQMAQCFHLGDWADFKRNFSQNDHSTLFLEKKNTEGVRLPYKICWFDYEANFMEKDIEQDCVAVSKRAVLAIEKEPDVLLFYFFWYADSIKRWIPNAVGSLVSVGKTFREKFKEIGAPAGNILPIPLFTTLMENPLNAHLDNQDDLCYLNKVLQMINCKNITTEKVKPSEKVNKKRIKKGKCPIFSYHILIIKPVGKKQEAQQAQGLWDNRVHLMRGHFKTYTEEKPLFGKVTGHYWWQPCVRGRNKKGIVMKDYSVNLQR